MEGKEGSSYVTEVFLFLDKVRLTWEHESHIWGTSYFLVKWKHLWNSVTVLRGKQSETETCHLLLPNCKFGNFHLDRSALVASAVLIWENTSASRLLIQICTWAETVLHFEHLLVSLPKGKPGFASWMTFPLFFTQSLGPHCDQIKFMLFIPSLEQQTQLILETFYDTDSRKEFVLSVHSTVFHQGCFLKIFSFDGWVVLVC